MKIDYSPRASGKTTRLIEWLRADPHRLMITFSIREEVRLKEIYRDVAERILDWHSYQRSSLGSRRIDQVCIDNVDLLLQRLCRESISLMSATTDELGLSDGSPESRSSPRVE